MDRGTLVTVNRWLALLAITLGTLALLAGDGPVPPGGPAEITALRVAKALRATPNAVYIADIRSKTAFEDLHLPRATHLPIDIDSDSVDSLRIAEWVKDFESLAIEPGGKIVIGGGLDTATREVWLALRMAGHQVSYMPDMLGDWVDTIVSPVRQRTEDPLELARWTEIADLSRYFGGFPRVVETLEIDLADTGSRLQQARRRGCAF